MNMGVARPGYELVTLLDPTGLSPSQATVETTACLLPNQIAIYLRLYVPVLLFTLLVVFGPKLHRSLTSRRFAQARANGLGVHERSHSRRLSRALGRRVGGIAEDSDEDALSDVENALAFSQAYPNSGPTYAYHSSADDDGLPTPAAYDFGAGSFPDFDRPGKKVRRVSRVWLWDGRNRPSDEYIAWLAWLGPVYRYGIRPLHRLVRSLFHRLWTPALSQWWARISGSAMVADTAREMGAIAWPALALTAAIWTYHL